MGWTGLGARCCVLGARARGPGGLGSACRVQELSEQLLLGLPRGSGSAPQNSAPPSKPEQCRGQGQGHTAPSPALPATAVGGPGAPWGSPAGQGPSPSRAVPGANSSPPASAPVPAGTRPARGRRTCPSPPSARGDLGPRLGVSPWALGHRLPGLKREPGSAGPRKTSAAGGGGGGGGGGSARGGERRPSPAGERRARLDVSEARCGQRQRSRCVLPPAGPSGPGRAERPGGAGGRGVPGAPRSLRAAGTRCPESLAHWWEQGVLGAPRGRASRPEPPPGPPAFCAPELGSPRAPLSWGRRGRGRRIESGLSFSLFRENLCSPGVLPELLLLLGSLRRFRETGNSLRFWER